MSCCSALPTQAFGIVQFPVVHTDIVDRLKGLARSRPRHRGRRCAQELCSEHEQIVLPHVRPVETL